MRAARKRGARSLQVPSPRVARPPTCPGSDEHRGREVGPDAYRELLLVVHTTCRYRHSQDSVLALDAATRHVMVISEQAEGIFRQRLPATSQKLEVSGGSQSQEAPGLRSEGRSRTRGSRQHPPTGTTAMTVTVMIVDPQPIFAAAIKAILDRFASFDVICLAHTLANALERPCLPDVDVIVVDVDLADACGDDVITTLNRRSPNAKIVSMLARPDHDTIIAHLRSGATGVLSKTIDHDLLVRRINDSATGLPAFDHETGPSFLAGLRAGATALPAATSRRVPVLSGREIEILTLYDNGSSTASIGQLLHLSPATVKTHVSRAMAKLGAATRSQALAMSRRQGLI